VIQVPESAIRDTAAAVFRDAAYNRTSPLQRLGAWLLDALQAVLLRLRPGQMSAAIYWVFVAMLILLAAAILGRAGYLLYLDRGGFGRRRRSRSVADAMTSGDAWIAARQYAARGDYTSAAHALYAALLQAFAARGDAELHESKTIGDYVRDLAARSSRLLGGFREFARSYETVIYGIGFCDRDRYEQLHGLALRIIDRR
jgi:hypothetical protein